MVKKEKHISLCPKCGSRDVGIDFSNPLVARFGIPANKKCHHCGHIGPVFPEVIESEAPKKPKNIKDVKKKELVDVRYGRFIFALWKFLGPIAILIGLVTLFLSPDNIFNSSFLLISGIIITYLSYRGK